MVLVGLTCGNWTWDCVIVGLGVFSWFFGTCSGLGLFRGGRWSRDGTVQQKNICTWLNKCNSLNLFKRVSNILRQSASLKGALHMWKVHCSKEVPDNANCSRILVLASTVKLHGHSDNGQFYSRISMFLCKSLRPCHALHFSTLETNHGKDLTGFQRYDLGAFKVIGF